MGLNDKIVELRKRRGMSQEELAEKLNVSRQAVSRWETGTAMPDAANLLQLSCIFGVSTDYLLGAEPSREKEWGKPPVEDGRIFPYLIILEVMAVLLQFLTTVILENSLFVILSCIPFLSMLVGFEYAYRHKAKQRTDTVRRFRMKLYKVSAWLGLYFPMRFIITNLFQWNSLLLRECMVLILYISAAFLITLSLDKSELKE
ncbi:MAG: helix-turn-helix transcriptional regulator [Oscillospiraceae bacterium]|nr:helix-turn-helix transcriptional regulator [Oscillospiraceae bacterium]